MLIARRSAWAAAIGVGLAFSLLGAAHPADAALTTCRTDPIVTLSNGVQIDIAASVADSASDILGITYTLHAPAGTSVVKVIYTAGGLGVKEQFLFVADNSPQSYDTITTVSTGTTGVAATATSAIRSTRGSASGHDRDDLLVHLIS